MENNYSVNILKKRMQKLIHSHGLKTKLYTYI